LTVLSGSALANRLAALVPHRHIPLLVIRVPELERLAWRNGRRAALRFERRARTVFATLARRVVRADDLIAHDVRSEIFSVALAGATRAGSGCALPADCRATLSRAAAAFGGPLESSLETGWTLVTQIEQADLSPVMHAALARGARERERYDFFSTVGHEMRAPLSAIRGYLETLLDEELDRTKTQRFLEIARSEAHRLSRLVDGMFAISLLDGGYEASLPRQTHTVSIRAALDDALAALGPRVAERQIRVRKGVAGSSEAAIARDRLVQILVNVIGNAIEHGERGGTIRIRSRSNARWSRIVVDDDGPGIPPGERELVFELGYRRTRGNARGSGLGLAVVRGLLERAGGNVEAGASPLGGTRIVIWVPAPKPST
jgi:signal transduction histidine kinase